MLNALPISWVIWSPQIIPCQGYISWSSSLCSRLHSPVTSSLVSSSPHQPQSSTSVTTSPLWCRTAARFVCRWRSTSLDIRFVWPCEESNGRVCRWTSTRAAMTNRTFRVAGSTVMDLKKSLSGTMISWRVSTSSRPRWWGEFHSQF